MAEGSQIDIPYHLDRLDQRYLPLDGIFDPIGDGKGVDIYILDSGIMYNHEEFGNRAKFSGYDPMDEFLNETWRGGDCYGHGTRVASNAAGVKYGVAKKATLYSVRVLDCTNGAPWSVVLDGMEHAMQKIAERKRPAIVSMSLSGRYIRVINEAVKILHSIGIPVVVAAGNNGLDACRYSPASAPNAITVGASADGDELPYFTNYGSCVDIFAPGADILGASHRCSNCSRISDGTSFACPLVSGAAAILLQQQPLLTPDEIFNRLVLLSTNNTLNFSTIPPYYQELTPNRALYIPGKSIYIYICIRSTYYIHICCDREGRIFLYYITAVQMHFWRAHQAPCRDNRQYKRIIYRPQIVDFSSGDFQHTMRADGYYPLLTNTFMCMKTLSGNPN